MIKKLINIVVIVLFILALFIIQHLTNQVDKLYERVNTSDIVMDSIINHYDDVWIYDVFMETDTWDNYSYLKYGED